MRPLALLTFLALAALLPTVAEARPRPRATPESRKADADRKAANKLLKEAAKLLADGDYLAALARFELAYKAFPSPKIFFNFGQTYKELGRHLDAILAYERFLREVPDAPKELAGMATKQIESLSRLVGHLEITVNEPDAEISVDGTLQGKSPLAAPIRLMPGRHSVVVKKDGFLPAVLELQVDPGRSTRPIVLQRPRPKVVEVQIVYRTIRKPKKGLKVLWTGVALTAALAVVATVTGPLTLQKKEIATDETRPVAERQDALKQGKVYRDVTDGMIFSAAGVAAATLIWYFVVVHRSGGTERIKVERSGPRVELTPVVGPGHYGLSAALRF
jgi:hypothetical protein